MQKLTRRELQVAELAAAGLTNMDIARRLNTAPQTVKNQMCSIYEKVGCNNRVGLARWFLFRALSRAAALSAAQYSKTS